MKDMRILVLSNEVWNDKINGNNVISNWFEGMDAEFANIYASPDAPDNKCCSNYFQITDSMMAKSIITRIKAGKRIHYNENSLEAYSLEAYSLAEAEPKKLYTFLKSISGSFLRFVREIIWLLGKYDIVQMQQFIEKFKPDIIFSERMASCKMLRLEKIVTELCHAPIVAFTGDDEYSLKQFQISPFFWINRFMVRRRLRQMVKQYQIYYTLSMEQKEEYEKIFGCKCKILHKCGEFSNGYSSTIIHSPIRMVYAGKFYCNRWKVLAQIVDVIKEINQEYIKIILEIYTRDFPTKTQKDRLDDRKNSYIMGGVSQEELKMIYSQSDIALHVESNDLKNRLATRWSFSTKIIDCIFSGCAVLAFCWKQHSGWTYLKREKAALCISDGHELKVALTNLCDNPQLIEKYARKAYECGTKNHLRKAIQEMMMDDFNSVIHNYKRGVGNEGITN